MQRKVGFKTVPDAPDLQSVIGKNIRRIMDRTKIKTADVAAEIGVSLATVQRAVNGTANPTVDTIESIANALHTTAEKLFMERVDHDLTGITIIDDTIFDVFAALWSDYETAKKLVGHRIHPDYRLFYCDAPTPETAVGPTWEDEIKINATHPHRVDYVVYSASILSETSIIIHNSTLSVHDTPKSNLLRAAKHESILKTEVIDIWELTHTVDEIRKNKDLKWQIMARKLKVLRESAEV